MIFDTDILVWYLKKRAEAAAFIQAIPIGERRVSVVSVLELLHGCRTRSELRDVREFVEDGLAEVLPITSSISTKAREIMQQFVLSRKPGALDALIAATALERGDVLATGNVKHFNYLPGLPIKGFSL